MSAEVGSEGEADGRTFFLLDGDSVDEEFLVGCCWIAPSPGAEAEHVEVILVCEIDGKVLVAAPQAAWHRNLSGWHPYAQLDTVSFDPRICRRRTWAALDPEPLDRKPQKRV